MPPYLELIDVILTNDPFNKANFPSTRRYFIMDLYAVNNCIRVPTILQFEGVSLQKFPFAQEIIAANLLAPSIGSKSLNRCKMASAKFNDLFL